MALNTRTDSLDAGASKLRLSGDIETAQAMPIELQKIILQYWIQQGDGSTADRIEDVPESFIKEILGVLGKQASAPERSMDAEGGIARLGYRGGQLVQPGPGRPGYQGPAGGSHGSYGGSSSPSTSGGGGGNGWQSYAIPSAPAPAPTAVERTAAMEDAYTPMTTIEALQAAANIPDDVLIGDILGVGMKPTVATQRPTEMLDMAGTVTPRLTAEEAAATEAFVDTPPIGYGEGKVDPGLAAAAGIGSAAAGFAGTTDVGEGGARSLTLPTGGTGGTGTGGEGINVPGTPIVPVEDTGLTPEESAQAFQESVEAQKAANLAAKAKLPFEDYYVGGAPTAEQTAFMKASGAAPSMVGLKQYAAGGGRMGYDRGGIANLRQPFFLGKIAKKLKKIVKSPVGKMALLAGLGMFGAGKFSGIPAGLKNLWSGKQIIGEIRGGKPALWGTRKGGIWDWIKRNKALTAGAAATLSPFLFQGEEEEPSWAGLDYDKTGFDPVALRRKILAGGVDPAEYSFVQPHLRAAQGGRAGYAGGLLVNDDDYISPRESALAALYNPQGTYVQRRRGIMASAGGRIGYRLGGNGDLDDPGHADEPLIIPDDADISPDDFWGKRKDIEGQMAGGIYEKALMDAWKTYKKRGGTLPLEQFADLWMREMMKGNAQGGRIGYDNGGIMLASDPGMGEGPFMLEEFLQAVKEGYKGTYEDFINDIDRSPADYMAQGGRIGAQEGGLMNLGGMEKDYRQEGGFVPIGGKEKADDVPARLSKNEFVFTADAVRAAGGGDIDAGAEVMENLMENLEAGGKVSEDSQGLEGARSMFANAQQLEKRII